jgi:rod shape-determining protein MreD
MKRAAFFLLMIIVSFTLQTTLLALPPLQRVRPDLLLILTVYFGFSTSMVSGGLLAFFMGYLLDLFSGNVFGLYAFTRSLIFLTARLFKHEFYWEGFSFQLVFVFTAAMLEGLLLLALLAALSPGPLRNLFPAMLTTLVPQSLCTALITLPLFFLLRKGTRFLMERQRLTIRGEG